MDYFDTFSPVTKLTTIQCLLALTAINRWDLHQLDVNNTFLQAELDEEVYMKLPLDFSFSGDTRVCKLQNLCMASNKQAASGIKNSLPPYCNMAFSNQSLIILCLPSQMNLIFLLSWSTWMISFLLVIQLHLL